MKITSIEIYPVGVTPAPPAPPLPPPPIVPYFEDSSGNYRYLNEYVPGSSDITSEAGLIPGIDGAFGLNTVPGFLGRYQYPSPIFLTSWWMCGWVDGVDDYATFIQLDLVGVITGVAGLYILPVDSLNHYVYMAGPSGSNVDSLANTPGPHFIFGWYNADTDEFQLYEDGVPLGDSFGTGFTPATIDTILVGGSPVSGSKIYDEVAFGFGVIDDATVAALYDAASDFTTFSAAILALNPEVYYHLNELITP